MVQKHTFTGNSDWYLVDRGQALVAMTTDLNSNQDLLIHCTLATGLQGELFRATAGRRISISKSRLAIVQ